MKRCKILRTASTISKVGLKMVDRLFAEPTLAELYDAFCVGRRDFDFYLPLVMSSSSVLDVGCGTGKLLCLARRSGHTGRLCGLDPADAMLDQARSESDVEWVLGNLSSVDWRREFDLIVMTGHAFQVLVDDEDIRDALGAIRSALTNDGKFVFETRNPQVREWESWIPENAVTIEHGGKTVTMAHQVEQPVEGDVVSFTTTFSSPSWELVQLSRSTLRFLSKHKLDGFLEGAGLVIEEQFGDWERMQLTSVSPEIITVAMRG